MWVHFENNSWVKFVIFLTIFSQKTKKNRTKQNKKKQKQKNKKQNKTKKQKKQKWVLGTIIVTKIQVLQVDTLFLDFYSILTYNYNYLPMKNMNIKQCI